jgi:hypothetical protein
MRYVDVLLRASAKAVGHSLIQLVYECRLDNLWLMYGGRGGSWGRGHRRGIG